MNSRKIIVLAVLVMLGFSALADLRWSRLDKSQSFKSSSPVLVERMAAKDVCVVEGAKIE